MDLVRAALTSCQRFDISYWDAAIIEAARALGCRTVLSEDLQHGASYGGVRVQNPFRVHGRGRTVKVEAIGGPRVEEVVLRRLET